MTTEWEDIQIRLGNLAPRDIPKPLTDQEYDAKAAENGEREEARKKSEKEKKKSEDEIRDELEDEFADDDKFLEQLRQKRIAELKSQANKEKYGDIRFITEPDYTKEVTEAGDVWVVVYLYKAGIPHCQLIEQKLRNLAKKFRATKFVGIRSEEAIRGYPDRNLPTVLVYYKGDVRKQYIGISSFGGEGATEDDIEWSLKKVGAVESEMEEDPREKQQIQNRKKMSSYVNRYSNWSDDEEDD